MCLIKNTCLYYITGIWPPQSVCAVSLWAGLRRIRCRHGGRVVVVMGVADCQDLSLDFLLTLLCAEWVQDGCNSHSQLWTEEQRGFFPPWGSPAIRTTANWSNGTNPAPETSTWGRCSTPIKTDSTSSGETSNAFPLRMWALLHVQADISSFQAWQHHICRASAVTKTCILVVKAYKSKALVYNTIYELFF